MKLLILQVTESTDFTKLADQEPWLSSTRLVVKPDMLFGKRGKSGLVCSDHLKRFEISWTKKLCGFVIPLHCFCFSFYHIRFDSVTIGAISSVIDT